MVENIETHSSPTNPESGNQFQQLRDTYEQAAESIVREINTTSTNPLTLDYMIRLREGLINLGDETEVKLLPVAPLTQKNPGLTSITERGFNHLPVYFERKIKRASQEARTQFKQVYEVRLTPENFGKAVRGLFFSMEITALLNSFVNETNDDRMYRFEDTIPSSKSIAVEMLLRTIHPQWIRERNSEELIEERAELLNNLRLSQSFMQSERFKAAFSKQLAVFKSVGFDLDFLQEHIGVHTVQEIRDLAFHGIIPSTVEQRELLEVFLHHDDTNYLELPQHQLRNTIKKQTGMIVVPELVVAMGLFGFETWRSSSVGGGSLVPYNGHFIDVRGTNHDIPPQISDILHHLGNDQDLAMIAVFTSLITGGLLSTTKLGLKLGPKLTAEVIQDVGLVTGLLGVILFKILENPNNIDIADIFGSTPSIALLKIATIFASKILDRFTIMRFNRKLKQEKRQLALSETTGKEH